MHATCINARNVDASLSYIMVILLNDTSYVKNLSTALLMLLYTFLSSLYGLPRLGLRLLFGSPSIFRSYSSTLKVCFNLLVLYAESPTTPLGLVLGLPYHIQPLHFLGVV